MSDHSRDALDRTGYWGTSAAGAILFSPNRSKFGLGRRSAEVLEPETLGSFGGAMEPGDSVDETIANELMEEIGYFMPSENLPLASFVDVDFCYHNHIAVIREAGFEPVFNWENTGIEWYTLDELLALPADDLHFGIQFVLMDAGAVDLMRKTQTAVRSVERRSAHEDDGMSL